MGDDDWKKKRRRKKDYDDDDDDRKDRYDRDKRRYPKTVKKSLVDRIFELLEGPIATTLVKMIATGLICATTVALTGILAFADASMGLLMSTVGLGLATTAITWIFGGWKKQAKAIAESKNHDEEILTLTNQLTELEERLTNVEIIERFEDRLAARVAESSPTSKDSSPGAETTYGSSGINFES